VKSHHVVLFVRGWKGDKQVAMNESVASLIQHLTIDGMDVHPEWAGLDLGGGTDFLSLELRGLPPEERARFPLEDVLEGTTESLVLLPVGRLEIAELKR
jgi:hypothetical protein